MRGVSENIESLALIDPHVLTGLGFFKLSTMKAHYTKFKGEEQFEVLREKASQLGEVYRYADGAISFGYDDDYKKYVAYRSFNNTKGDENYYYQGATYLPYDEYLLYLDRCIKERDV